MTNIFVGNLAYQTTESELEAAFAAYGAVEKTSVVRDRDTGQPRGFAFVEMTNQAEAMKAIEALNGQELNGRALNVNEARPRPERGGFGGGGGRGGGGRRSDIQLKQDIVPLTRLNNGLTLYRFHYKGSDHTAYVGVMAQEVQKIAPAAVGRDQQGYLTVDYGRIGVKFMTWKEWLEHVDSRTTPRN